MATPIPATIYLSCRMVGPATDRSAFEYCSAGIPSARKYAVVTRFGPGREYDVNAGGKPITSGG